MSDLLGGVKVGDMLRPWGETACKPCDGTGWLWVKEKGEIVGTVDCIHCKGTGVKPYAEPSEVER